MYEAVAAQSYKHAMDTLRNQLQQAKRRYTKAEKGAAYERARANNYLTKIVALRRRNEELELRVTQLEEQLRGARYAILGPEFGNY